MIQPAVPSESVRRPPVWLAGGIALLAGLVVSAAGFAILRSYETRQIATELDRHVDNHFSVLRQIVERQDLLLTSLQNLFLYSDEISSQAFHGAARELRAQEPGLRWIDWAPRIDGADRERFEAGARDDATPPVRIVERGPDGQLRPAQPRAEHFPLLFVEPASDGSLALGFDLAADPARLARIHAARDAAAGRIVLEPELLRGMDGDTALVVLVPVYVPGRPLQTMPERRAAFRGCIQAVYSVEKLLWAHLKTFPEWGLDWMILARNGGEEHRLYFHASPRRSDAAAPADPAAMRAGLHRERRHTKAGIDFTALYRPAPEWLVRGHTLLPWSVLLGGSCTSVLAAAWVLSLSRRRRVVERQVVERTAELSAATARLKESEARFRTFMENSPAVAWLKDHEFRYRYFNEAFREAFQVTCLELEGKDDFTWQPQEIALELRNHDEWVLQTGKPLEVVQNLPARDGAMRHWLVSRFPFPAADGRTWVGGMAFDITERRAAEVALRESRQRLDLAIEGAALAVWDRNLATGRTVWNARWTEMLGYTPEEISPSKEAWEKLLHPDDRPLALAALNDHLEGRTPQYQCEFRLQMKSGGWKWIHATGRVVEYDAAGRPLRMAGTQRDISERKRAEAVSAALSSLGRRLSEARTAGRAAEVILQTAAELFAWDAAYISRYDSDKDEVSTLLVMDTVEGERRVVTAAYENTPPSPIGRRVIDHGPLLILRDQEQPDPGELVPFGDASRRSVSLMYAPIRDGGRVIGLLSVQSYKPRAYGETDLAVLQTLADHAGGALERLRAEETLLASEQRFRSLVESAPVGVWQVGPDGTTIHYLSPTLRRMLEISPDEPVTELKMRSFIHPRHHPELERHLKVRMAGGTSSYEIEYVTRSGRRVPVLVYGAPLLAPDGALAGSIGLSIDITERRRAQEVLQQERNLLRTLIDHLPDCIYIKDRTGAYVLTNHANHRLFNIPPGEGLTGKTVFDFFPQEVASLYAADDRLVLEEGRSVLEREEPFVTPDGRPGWFLTTKIPLRDISGNVIGLVGISRDITAHKHAEEEKARIQRKLEETQKLESLGVLAGGIAHDFNNLLTGILGNATLVKMDLPPGSTLQGYIEEIEKASLRAADLCKQMLAYAGKGRLVVKPIHLSALVQDSAPLLRLSVGKSALLRFHLADRLPAVSADATQLRQILMNLVINASEAIGEKSGLITVTTGLMRADRAYLAGTHLAPDLPEGDFVYLEVGDTGCGMDKETLGKIFDPFFTTKFLGRGLGLAAVLGIVRSHNGALKVVSEPGKGTTFRLLLPCIGSPAEEASVSAPRLHPWRGSGVVLVVDDEDTVRTITARTLESFGFNVVLAADGVEAVKIFRERKEPFTLVVLDLTMPHKDGVETFAEIRRLRPEARVLLMSGFNEQEAVSRFTGKGLAGFLQKPFTAEDLQRKVREVVDAP